MWVGSHSSVGRPISIPLDQLEVTAGQLPKAILCPGKISFLQRPDLRPNIQASSTSGYVHRHQVIHPRVCLLCVGTAAHCGKHHLPLFYRRLHSFLQRIVEGHSVRQRPRWVVRSHNIPHISEVVYRHASTDDDNALVSERSDSLPKAVVLVWILGFEERDLDQGHIERVLNRVEC